MNDASQHKNPIERLPTLIRSIKGLQAEVVGMQNRWDTIPPGSRSNENNSVETPSGPRSIAYVRGQLNDKKIELCVCEAELYDYIEQACAFYFAQDKEVGSTLAAAESAKQIAAEALRIARDTAAISSSEPFVAFFLKRIRELFWPVLGWGIISLGFLFAALVFLFRQKMPDAPVTETSIALFISNRAIVTAILAGSAIWCARLFRSAYDRREMYFHRAVITRTYQSFEASALDPASKNLIAREAIRHIFSPLPGDRDDGNAKSEIEMLKDIIVPMIKKPSSE